MEPSLSTARGVSLLCSAACRLEPRMGLQCHNLPVASLPQNGGFNRDDMENMRINYGMDDGI